MVDERISGNQTSRVIKFNAVGTLPPEGAAGTDTVTWSALEQFLNRTDGLSCDIAINTAGIPQEGTPLNQNTLLSEAAETAIWGSASGTSRTPSDAFVELGSKKLNKAGDTMTGPLNFTGASASIRYGNSDRIRLNSEGVAVPTDIHTSGKVNFTGATGTIALTGSTKVELKSDRVVVNSNLEMGGNLLVNNGQGISCLNPVTGSVSTALTFTPGHITVRNPLNINNSTSFNNNLVDGVPTPTEDNHAANKAYVDNKFYDMAKFQIIQGTLQTGNNTFTSEEIYDNILNYLNTGLVVFIRCSIAGGGPDRARVFTCMGKSEYTDDTIDFVWIYNSYISHKITCNRNVTGTTYWTYSIQDTTPLEVTIIRANQTLSINQTYGQITRAITNGQSIQVKIGDGAGSNGGFYISAVQAIDPNIGRGQILNYYYNQSLNQIIFYATVCYLHTNAATSTTTYKVGLLQITLSNDDSITYTLTEYGTKAT